MMTKRINSVDILRLISAFAVVCIHTSYFAKEYALPIMRFAVPIFFIISGYFYCRADISKKKSQIKHILFLAVCAILFYFCVQLVTAAFSGDINSFFVQTFTLDNLWRFAFFNYVPDKLGDHLWFLFALLYCMICDIFVSKFKINLNVYRVLITLFLIVNIIIGSYSKLIFGIWPPIEIARSFIFTGLPFFYIGKLLRQAEKISASNFALISLSIVFAVTSVCEYVMLNSLGVSASKEMYISTVILAITLFCFVIKNPLYNPNKFLVGICNYGKKYSLMIYIIHPMMVKILNPVVSHMGSAVQTLYNFTSPIIIFIGALVFAMIFYKLKSCLKSKYIVKKG